MDLALIADVDRMAATAVPAEEVRMIGGWRARRSTGLPLKRANSVFPLGDQGASLSESLAVCERFYGERGLPTRFQISPASQPTGLTEQLLIHGYEAHSTTATYTCDLTELGPPVDSTGMEVRLTRTPSQAWWSTHNATAPLEPSQRDATEAMFTRIAEELIFVHVSVRGAAAGVGMSVLDGHWFGIFYIATSPRMRRQGVGRVVVDSLMQWARGRGAQRGYVQVEAGNRSALLLYDRAGYRAHLYDYRYLSKGPVI